MKNVSASLLIDAINELKERYTSAQFGEHLARFKTILERSTTLSEHEKSIVEEHVKEYNSLIEESPFFQDLAKQVELPEAKRMVTIVVGSTLSELSRVCQGVYFIY